MSIQTNFNYYEILDVSFTATEEEIKQAYKNKALEYHPDKASKNNLTFENATELFKQLNNAYAVLSSSEQRKEYDKKFSHLKMKSSTTNFASDTFSFGSSDSKSTSSSQFNKKDDSETIFYPKEIDQVVNAIIDGDSPEVLDELFNKKSPDSSSLKSVFYTACWKGKFNIVKYLIEVWQLNPNLKVDVGLPFTGPIFKAAAKSGNLTLVKYLLEVHHIDIESQGLTAGTRSTALSEAVKEGHDDVVEYLISKKANVNPQVSYTNILNLAIESKKLLLVMMLVKAGREIDDFNLERALEQGCLDIVDYLLEVKPNIKPHLYSSSSACKVVQSGNVALAKYLEKEESLDLLKKYPSWKDHVESLLTAAGESGSAEMINFLLDEKGLNQKVMENPKYIESILSSAIERRKLFPKKSDDQEYLKFVKFLMEERKLLLEKKSLERIIKECAKFSSIEMNSYLQSYLHDMDSSKRCFLLTIANQGLECLTLGDLFKLYNSKLIKKGKWDDYDDLIQSHIQERKISGEDLKKYLQENEEMKVEALFYYSSFESQDNLSYLKILLDLGVDLNAENENGLAAIHRAIRFSRRGKIVQFFIDHKVDLSKKDKQGRTAAEILGWKK